jgi:hypothetical protein
MTREEALKEISKLSCAYQNVRMTDCSHCRNEVESMVKILAAVKVEEEYDCPIHGKLGGINECPKC